MFCRRVNSIPVSRGRGTRLATRMRFLRTFSCTGVLGCVNNTSLLSRPLRLGRGLPSHDSRRRACGRVMKLLSGTTTDLPSVHDGDSRKGPDTKTYCTLGTEITFCTRGCSITRTTTHGMVNVGICKLCSGCNSLFRPMTRLYGRVVFSHRCLRGPGGSGRNDCVKRFFTPIVVKK